MRIVWSDPVSRSTWEFTLARKVHTSRLVGGGGSFQFHNLHKRTSCGDSCQGARVALLGDRWSPWQWQCDMDLCAARANDVKQLQAQLFPICNKGNFYIDSLSWRMAAWSPYFIACFSDSYFVSDLTTMSRFIGLFTRYSHFLTPHVISIFSIVL